MLKLEDVVNIFDKESKKSFLPEVLLSGVSIDSRNIKQGELFAAIEGKNCDGHDFLEEAFDKGAVAALVREKKIKKFSMKKNFLLIPVSDVQTALQELALAYRNKFKGKVIAVTGSNGKTTTKDMIAHVLSAKFKVLKTEGTQNNYLGLPLTLLKLKEEHETVVVELGANKSGEIYSLKEIAKPDVGVITNIGQSHLEFLKTKEGVLNLKWELFSDGNHKVEKAFLNFDDEALRNHAAFLKKEIIFFGTQKNSHYYANDIRLNAGRIEFLVNDKYKVSLDTIGRHNMYNALAAWAVSVYFGIPEEDIQKALASFCFPPDRLEFKHIKNIFLINDSYNANPQSVKAALAAMASFKDACGKIACLSDMRELGEDTDKLHYEIGLEAGRLGIDTVISFGQFSEFTIRGAEKGGVGCCVNVKDKDSALDWLVKNVKPKQIILFKGSRAVKMEGLCKCFINSYIT